MNDIQSPLTAIWSPCKSIQALPAVGLEWICRASNGSDRALNIIHTLQVGYIVIVDSFDN